MMEGTRQPAVTVGFFLRERFGDSAASLQSIVRHTTMPYTLIIVECGAPWRYVEEMEDVVAGLQNVRWIRTGGYVTVNASRNLIAGATDDEYVCMIENACRVDAGWLERLVVAGEETDAGIILPLTVESGLFGRKMHHDRSLGWLERSVQDGTVIRRLIPDSASNRRKRASVRSTVTLFENHCVMYRRTALRALGPFDAMLTAGTHVDTACAADALGIRAIMEPRAVVTHLPTRALQDDEKAFYAFRWDLSAVDRSRIEILRRWNLAAIPDYGFFARGQLKRSDPLAWQLHRAKYLPRVLARRLGAVRIRTKDRLGKLLTDDYMRDSAIIFVISMSVGLLNFLFHPILARLLSFEDYGEVNALLVLHSGLITFLGVFAAAVMNITANADDHDHRDATERARIITALRNIVMVAAGTLFIVTLFLSQPLRDLLQFESNLPIAGLAFTFLISVPLMFRRAYLGGTKRFFEAGLSRIVELGSRLLFVPPLIAAGLRAMGAVVGIVLAAIVGLLYSTARTRRDFRYLPGVGLVFDVGVRRELRYAALVLTVSATITFLSMGDILIVKHYFEPEIAGAYAGMSVVGKIVLYMSSASSGALAPYLRIKASARDNQVLLGKTLMIVLALGGGTFAALSLLPRLAIRLVVGARYISGAELLPKLALLMLLIACVNSILRYYMALRQRFVGVLGLGCVAFVITLCAIDHGSPAVIVGNFTYGVMLLLGIFAVRWTMTIIKHRLYVRT